MAGKQRSATSSASPPVNGKCYQLDVLKSIDTTGCYLDRNRFYLPVTLPSCAALPADVALWLVELRHKSDSSDLVPAKHTHTEDSVWTSEEEDIDDHLSQPEEESVSERLPTEENDPRICMDVDEDEDTVLNLDLHRKKGAYHNKIYDENDLFQIWEGLRIPRQSLCSSLRVPNLNPNCEVLSHNSENDSKSNIENPRSHSFWEENPMYSKGGLKNTESSVNVTLGVVRQEHNIPYLSQWYPSCEEYRDLREVEVKDTCDSSPRKETDRNEACEREMASPDKSVSSENCRLTDITEESIEDVGFLLNHENNFGFEENTSNPQCEMNNSNLDLIKCETRKKIGPNTIENGETDLTVKETSEQNSPLKLKCVNILNNLDEMIQTFEQIQQRVFSNSDDGQPPDTCIKDHEFDNMCERAEHIIEETLKCQLNSNNSAVKVQKKSQPLKKERISSDMSDEVFLTSTMDKESSCSPVFSSDPSHSQQDHTAVDINAIFDDGSKTTPPVPPVRKKKIHEQLNTTINNEKSNFNNVETSKARCEEITLQKSKHSYENIQVGGYSGMKNQTSAEVQSNKMPERNPKENVTNAKENTNDKANFVHKETTKTSDLLVNRSRDGNVANIDKKIGSEPDKVKAQSEKQTEVALNSHLERQPADTANVYKVDSDKRKENHEKITRMEERRSNTANELSSIRPESGKHRTELTVNIESGTVSTFKDDQKNISANKNANISTFTQSKLTETKDNSKNNPKPMDVDASESAEPEECLSFDSTDSLPFDPKIHLTQTRPISFTTFPPAPAPKPVEDRISLQAASLPRKIIPLVRDQQKPSNPVQNIDIFGRSNSIIGRPISFHTFSKVQSSTSILPDTDMTTTLLKYSNTADAQSVSSHDTSKTSSPCGTPKSSRPKSYRSSMDTNSLEESLERTRKGSNASDIAAWKLRLKLTSSYYHDEELDPNSMMSKEWFSTNDGDHSLLAEDPSKDSSWPVPDINVTPCKKGAAPAATASAPQAVPTGAATTEDARIEKLSVANIASLLEAELRGTQHGPYRVKKAKSMVLVYPKGNNDEKAEISSKHGINWAEHWDDNVHIIKESILHRTKIAEHGKKVRKNWVASYAVLTTNYLLFFKDSKTFQTMKTSPDKFNPELTIDLNGAVIEYDDKLSSRKNVLVVSDNSGLQVLIQLSSSSTTEQWYHHIVTATTLLGPSENQHLPSRECSPNYQDKSLPDESYLKSPKMSRSKSVKLVNKDLASNEDLSASAEERQTKNKARLKKFFVRRPTKESLVKKGIYKDEPMFGRNLCDVVADCNPSVPRFVTQCIRAIEGKEENMKTDGLYRASGNLSQVQKIRLQADQNQLFALDQEDDVHVLTGALKLFFRELKKPLIPCELFHKAIAASAIRDHKERVHQFRQLIQALPTPNHNTLDFLLQHLLKVNSKNEFNRMHIPNIAIVFGPTLMWPEEESVNMALDLMKQNLVIERLLVEYHEIFS